MSTTVPRASRSAGQGNVSVDEIEQAVEDLEVIEIVLRGENAQVVFGSLNSTGLALSSVDLVWNFNPHGDALR